MKILALVIMVLPISKQHHFFIRVVSVIYIIRVMKLSFIAFCFIATKLRGAYKVIPYNEAEYKTKVI